MDTPRGNRGVFFLWPAKRGGSFSEDFRTNTDSENLQSLNGHGSQLLTPSTAATIFFHIERNINSNMAVSAIQRPLGWPRWAKAMASLAIVVQLLAVVAEPLRFFTYGTTRGSSPAADPVRLALAPYVEFAFLNHGYFFFAPEPGPSHLMLCTLHFPDGTVSQVRYPDKTAQRPRLLYHRHFMLAEFLNQLHTPPVDPLLVREAPPQEAEAWTANRMRYEMIRESMQSHLVDRFGAASASIDRMRHVLPGSDAVLQQRLPLDDPSLLIVLPDSLESPIPPAQDPGVGPPPVFLPVPREEEVESLP